MRFKDDYYGYRPNCPRHGQPLHHSGRCYYCEEEKLKLKDMKMADKPMPAEVPKTRIERFRESADQLKDKNKKMQEAIKYLDKHPGLENFLEEFMKAGQNGWA